MAKTAIERLAEAIGYPDRVPAGVTSFLLRADGAELLAEEADGRLFLQYVLTEEEALLPSLATYAAGRMLKEDATLAYGRMVGKSSAEASSAFLWQSVPVSADARDLLRLFETFMDSCDWWRARTEALAGHEPAPAAGSETMMIRP